MNNTRCINLACVCNVGATGDACSDYCAKPPAEPREDFCRCGHSECEEEMRAEERPAADDTIGDV